MGTISKLTLYMLFMWRYYCMASNPINGMYQKKKFILFSSIIFLILMYAASQIAYIYNYNVYFSLVAWKVSIDVYYQTWYRYLVSAWIVSVLDASIVIILSLLISQTILKIVVGMHKFSNRSSNSIKISLKRQSKQMTLVHLSTKILNLSMLSVISSLFWSWPWLICETTGNYQLYWVTNLYAVDNIINILCVYLMMGFASDHYEVCCNGSRFGCHRLCLECILKFITMKGSRKGAISFVKDTKQTELPQIVPDDDDSDTADETKIATLQTMQSEENQAHHDNDEVVLDHIFDSVLRQISMTSASSLRQNRLVSA